MATNGNANAVPFIRNSNLFRKRIKDSIILQYDIARQGATNESMAVNPILKDLSGNGHDATCYNFGWSGMSGIGGYVQSNSNIGSNDSSLFSVSVSDNIITYQKIDGTVMRADSLVLYSLDFNKDVKTKVKAGKYGLNVYAYGDPLNKKNILSLQPYEIGSFTYSQSDYDDGRDIIMFGNTINVPVGETNSFEFLPLYPNALVFDGKDDYALVEGLPLLNKKDGYTVVLKRKWLKNTDVRHCLVSKNTRWESTEEGGVDGAFVMECDIYSTRSFGISTRIDKTLEDTDDFVYQTSKSYNGETTIKLGDKQDADHLCIAAINKGTLWHSSIAVYSLILFNRDLSTKEIEWVRANLI